MMVALFNLNNTTGDCALGVCGPGCQRCSHKRWQVVQEIDMKAVVRRLLQDTEGQDLIEYALLAALIGLAVTTAMTSLDGAITNTFSNVSSQLGS